MDPEVENPKDYRRANSYKDIEKEKVHLSSFNYFNEKTGVLANLLEIKISNKVAYTANKIYKEFYQENNLSNFGLGYESCQAGAFYLSLRHHQYPITRKEVAHLFRVHKKDLNKSYKILKQELEIKSLQPIKTIEWVERYFSNVYPSESKKVKREIKEVLDEYEFVSGSNKVEAAALLYYCGQRASEKYERFDMCATKTYIAGKVGATPESLRDKIKQIKEKVEE